MAITSFMKVCLMQFTERFPPSNPLSFFQVYPFEYFCHIALIYLLVYQSVFLRYHLHKHHKESSMYLFSIISNKPGALPKSQELLFIFFFLVVR